MYQKAMDAQVSNIQVSERGQGCPSNRSKGCASVDAQNLVDRHNIPIETFARTNGAIARLPVTLAELKVKFFIQSIVDLPEPVLEIKDIKKDLMITECTLLQPTNVLFVKGFIRKSIDFSTRSCSNLEGVCGDLRHCTVDVPFEFTTPIECMDTPLEPILNERKEFEFLAEGGCACRGASDEADRFMSKDFSQFNQESFKFFNKQPFCEPIFSKIVEFDKAINRRRPRNIELPFEERTFTKLEEKMIIELGLRIFQEQQVVIPASGCRGDRKDRRDNKKEE